MNTFTTLTKTFKNGTVSRWTFGQLRNGWFVAHGMNGKQRFFKTMQHMDDCIQMFMYRYGYRKPSTELIKKLATVSN